MSTKSDLFTIQTAQFRGANCIGMDTEIFFPSVHEEPARVEMLRAICAGCPVIVACRKDADETGDEGFRAGTTYKERRANQIRAGRGRGKGALRQQPVSLQRMPRVLVLRAQGLTNVAIAKSMGLPLPAIEKVIRLIKDAEVAA